LSGYIAPAPFKVAPGDSVSCVLNMDDGVLKMSRNGEPMVSVFEGLKGTLYPCVVITRAGTEVCVCPWVCAWLRAVWQWLVPPDPPPLPKFACLRWLHRLCSLLRGHSA
jgi:hypothetical protein